jgi:hypothetical protein
VVTLRGDTPGLSLRTASEVEVAAGDVAAMPVTVGGPAEIRGRHAVHFDVRARDGSASETVDSSFFGPM